MWEILEELLEDKIPVKMKIHHFSTIMMVMNLCTNYEHRKWLDVDLLKPKAFLIITESHICVVEEKKEIYNQLLNRQELPRLKVKNVSGETIVSLPDEEWIGHPNYSPPLQNISLHDYFAGCALTGLLANEWRADNAMIESFVIANEMLKITKEK